MAQWEQEPRREAGRTSRRTPVVEGERQSERWCRQELRIPTDLACWPGHFPGLPIVPGVVQLDWVMALASKWLGGSPRLARIDALKFKSLIRPGARLVLSLERDAIAGNIQFRLASRDEIHAMGRLVLAEASDRT